MRARHSPRLLLVGSGPAAGYFAGVTKPTPTASTALTVAGLPEVVRDLWAESGVYTEQTLLRGFETITRFAARLMAQGVVNVNDISEAHCSGFVRARTRDGVEPELATMHARRTTLRSMFRALRDAGSPLGDPTMDIPLPPRSSAPARPLTDDEVMLGRAASRLGQAGGSHLQRAVAWALAETTAVTSEMTAIRLGDLDDPEQPKWISLPGTRRHDARVGELSEWGSAVVARQAALLREHRRPAATLLLYRGKGDPGQHVAQAAACNAVGAVLDAAGLSHEPDIRPASVRNWAGRRLWVAGMPLEQVARRMGSRSLDAAAEDIALDWRPR